MQKLRLTHRRRLDQFSSAFDRTDPQGLSPLSSLSFSPSAFHSRIAEMDHPGDVRRRTPAPDAGCVERTRWLHEAAIRVRTPQEGLSFTASPSSSIAAHGSGPCHFRGFVPVALILVSVVLCCRWDRSWGLLSFTRGLLPAASPRTGRAPLDASGSTDRQHDSRSTCPLDAGWRPASARGPGSDGSLRRTA